jgi:hypothetical protein
MTNVGRSGRNVESVNILSDDGNKVTKQAVK